MKIDNNYTQYRQPNFGRLKSITYHEKLNPDIYPEEIAELLRTIKESKAFNEFFKKYDVDMLFDTMRSSIDKKEYVNLTLETTVPKTKGNNWYPKIIFSVNDGNKETLYRWDLINRLTQKIKDVEFSDLKMELDNLLKQLEVKEKGDNLQQKARAEIADITNSLLTQDLPVESKKKTFFEKLFGWLK